MKLLKDIIVKIKNYRELNEYHKYLRNLSPEQRTQFRNLIRYALLEKYYGKDRNGNI